MRDVREVMADQKFFAGHAIKRLRRKASMTQLALADALDISPSYLNLLERNQRPLSAALMLDHLEQFAAAKRIRTAVEQTLAAGHKTRDLGGQLSTQQMTDKILAFI